MFEPSHNDTINYTSSTTDTVSLDRQGNSGASYRIGSGGKAINFTAWMAPGTLRPADYGTTEIENVNFTLPNADLDVNQSVDLLGTFSDVGRRVVQNADITADTVKLTTDRGLQVDHEINTTNNGDVLLRVTGKNQSNYTNSFASARASISGGAITAANVTSGGNYYDFAPVATIRGNGTGSGAELSTTVNNGAVNSVSVLHGGNSYLNTPAPQVWIAPPASLQLDAPVSSSTIGSLPGAGDGRGRITVMADAGAVDTNGDVVFPTASHITWSDGDYVYASNDRLDNITPAAYPGVVAGGSGATAVAMLDSDGRVTSIHVTNGGSGYSNDLLPTVSMIGGAVATAVVGSDGTVTGFHITNPGEGYAAPPVVSILSNGFGKIIGATPTETALNRSYLSSANGDLIAVGYYGVGDPDKPLKTAVATLVAQTNSPAASVNVLKKTH